MVRAWVGVRSVRAVRAVVLNCMMLLGVVEGSGDGCGGGGCECEVILFVRGWTGRSVGGVGECCGCGELMCCVRRNWYVWMECGCVDDGFFADCGMWVRRNVRGGGLQWCSTVSVEL